MVVTSKIKCIIVADDGKSSFLMQRDFIGEIPVWVEKHWYFKALMKDGKVSVILTGASAKKAKSNEDNEDDEKAKVERADYKKELVEKAKERAIELGFNEKEAKEYVQDYGKRGMAAYDDAIKDGKNIPEIESLLEIR